MEKIEIAITWIEIIEIKIGIIVIWIEIVGILIIGIKWLDLELQWLKLE